MLFEFLSDKWIIASHTEMADENNYDVKIYTNDGNEFAIIDYRDVFFEGKKVGTIGRTDYDYGYAYGDYLVYKDKVGNVYGYNKDFVKSPIQADYLTEYTEIRENGEYVKYHVGSGQKAFCPECTLTKDEVSSWLTSDSKWNYYDLQGNLLFSAGNVAVSISNFSAGSAYTRMADNVGKGLLRIDGATAIPCVYDDVNYYDPINRFVAVNKGGKLAYCDVNGNETFVTNYPYDSCKVYNNFAWIQDLDGTLIVITPKGQLEQHYAEAQYNLNSTAELLVVKDLDGKVGVIDVDGNEVLPLNILYKDTYNIEISNDGSVIIVCNNDTHAYEVYSVPASADTAPAEVEQPEQPEQQTEQTEPAAEEDGSWVCPSCGTANTGNFCTNDGTKKPEEEAEDGSWVCPECGNKNEGNFCANDGTKKPE